MVLNKYRNQLVAFLFWAVCVVFLFKLIEDKKVAALIAGAGFVLWPIVFLFLELRSTHKSKLHIGVLGLFLVTSALPIFFLRIVYWDADFSSLSLFGIPAVQLHRSSNFFYMLVMVSCFYHSWKLDRKFKKEQPPIE